MTRGYAAVGLHMPKTDANVAGALRASGCYGASMLAVAGSRYRHHAADTQKAWRHMPMHQVDDLRHAMPYRCTPVAVDIVPGAIDLRDYTHPESAFYVFGPEDGTLGDEVLSWCRVAVYVPTRFCMNLAAAVNVVLYDRFLKMREAA